METGQAVQVVFNSVSQMSHTRGGFVSKCIALFDLISQVSVQIRG